MRGRRPTNSASRFQFTGQIALPEAQLYHYKARAYLPQLGRFAQTDPILFAGGMNLYAYVGNDPVNFVDPWGLRGCLFLQDQIEVCGVCPQSAVCSSVGFEYVFEQLRVIFEPIRARFSKHAILSAMDHKLTR